MLTEYLQKCLDFINVDNKHFDIITPRNPEERGATLTLSLKRNASELT